MHMYNLNDNITYFFLLYLVFLHHFHQFAHRGLDHIFDFGSSNSPFGGRGKESRLYLEQAYDWQKVQGYLSNKLATAVSEGLL